MEIARARNDTLSNLWVHRVLVLLCLIVLAIRPPWSSLILIALSLTGLYLKFNDACLLGLTSALWLLLRTVAIINRLWVYTPLALIAGLTVWTLVIRYSGGGRYPVVANGSLTWIRKGDFGRRQIAIAAVIAVLSALALVLWYFIVKPDISDIWAKIRNVHPVLLIAAGLLWSIINATSEEFLWRGMIFDALERNLTSSAAVISIQALSFGAAHFHGFPRGASGMVLASIYGFMLGYLRKQANGLLAPIVAHVFGDITIFLIVASTLLP
ncbi:MAG: CPBP family intramembrane glutamic endopeptidase [Syntrophobacteraceae bacterium]